MRALRSLLPLCLLAGLLAGCPSSPRGLLIYRGEQTHPPLAAPGRDTVEITYLGVGGYVVRRGGDAIMFAPSFTNPSLLGLLSARSDPDLVDRCMRRVDSVEDVQWILAGHAHYDHLMDVPRVMAAHAPHSTLVGSRTAHHLLAAAFKDRTLAVNACAARADGRPGQWIYNATRTLRVLPIESEHSAHWWILHFLGGRHTRDLKELPNNAWDWRQGQTYAYLVDFLDPDGRVAFRIHYQDAASTYPLGFVPEAVRQEYPRVDLAILCVGASSTARHYPSLTLKNTQPRYIVLGHWEDFFANQRCEPGDKPPQVVRLADIHEFIARVERHKTPDAEWMLPAPYTTLHLPVQPAAFYTPPPTPWGACSTQPGEIPSTR